MADPTTSPIHVGAGGDIDPPLHRVGHVELPSSLTADPTPAPTVIDEAIQHGGGTQTDYGLIAIGDPQGNYKGKVEGPTDSTTLTGSVQGG